MDRTTAKRDPPKDPEDFHGRPDRSPRVDKEGPTTAKLFMHGRSQAVRLPKEFRFPGKEVRIRRDGVRVILEPVEFDVKAWFKRLDSFGDVPFMPEGREQPDLPPDDEIDLDK
jgi:antitoxin VapB